jgi:hypothetical protein
VNVRKVLFGVLAGGAVAAGPGDDYELWVVYK